MEAKVRIDGLRQFRSALRKIDSDLPKELSREFGRIAAALAEKVSNKVARRSGRAAASYKGQSGGKIAFGGRAAEHAAWLDFGGRVGPGKRIFRERVEGGRYLYPTLRDERESIKRDTDEALARVVRSAGFDTEGHA